MSNPEFIDPKDIRPGPIRHSSLPEEWLEQIEGIYGVVGPFLNSTLEQFEINFMRDADPESEIAIWTSIIAAWLDYHDKFLNGEEQDAEQEKKLFAALILISTGVDDVTKLDVPDEVGQRLLQCYDDLGKV